VTRLPHYCETWNPDPDIPPDHRGRRTCLTCHRIGSPDDPGHTPPAPPARPAPKPLSPALAAAAREFDAAILGERED
jgi:hypothetical protein